jgi:hypothetical protein
MILRIAIIPLNSFNLSVSVMGTQFFMCRRMVKSGRMRYACVREISEMCKYK